MRLHRPTTLALAGMLVGCGGGTSDYSNGTGPGATCTPTATRVCMTSSNTFNPTTLTVVEGTQVTWQNGSSVLHSVTSDHATEQYNQDVGANGSFSHTFSTAGSYPYHCRFHGSPSAGMNGTIVVEQPPTQPTPPPY